MLATLSSNIPLLNGKSLLNTWPMDDAHVSPDDAYAQNGAHNMIKVVTTATPREANLTNLDQRDGWIKHLRSKMQNMTRE